MNSQDDLNDGKTLLTRGLWSEQDGKTLLGRICREIECEKQHLKDERAAKQFLKSYLLMSELMRKLGEGTVKRLVGTATVPLGVASLATGIPEGTLRHRAALNELNPDAFLLNELADLAGLETASGTLTSRHSYQASVRAYIRNRVAEPNGSSLAKGLQYYFDMEEVEAKYHEAYLRTLAAYFEMYPPPLPAASPAPPAPAEPVEPSKPTSPSSAAGQEGATANDVKRTTVNDAPTLGAWAAAVDDYERKHMRAKNDALHTRLRILLEYLQGVPFSDLEDKHKGRTIARDLKTARTEDVPRLMELYPKLPPLDLEKRT